MPTVDQIADGLGVSDKTIRQYWRRGCPRHSVAAVVEWRRQHIKAVAEDAESSEVMMENKRADLEKTREAAKAQRLKNEALEGTLIDRGEIERDLRIAIGRIRCRLMSVGTECANVAPGSLKAVVKSLVEDRVRLVMQELANASGQH